MVELSPLPRSVETGYRCLYSDVTDVSGPLLHGALPALAPLPVDGVNIPHSPSLSPTWKAQSLIPQLVCLSKLPKPRIGQELELSRNDHGARAAARLRYDIFGKPWWTRYLV